MSAYQPQLYYAALWKSISVVSLANLTVGGGNIGVSGLRPAAAAGQLAAVQWLTQPETVTRRLQSSWLANLVWRGGYHGS